MEYTIRCCLSVWVAVYETSFSNLTDVHPRMPQNLAKDRELTLRRYTHAARDTPSGGSLMMAITFLIHRTEVDKIGRLARHGPFSHKQSSVAALAAALAAAGLSPQPPKDRLQQPPLGQAAVAGRATPIQAARPNGASVVGKAGQVLPAASPELLASLQIHIILNAYKKL